MKFDDTLRRAMNGEIEAMKEVVKAKIRACGSENKSWI